MKITSYIPRFWQFARKHWIVSLMGILLVAGGVWWYLGTQQDTYQFVTVTKGSIIETVAVTGSTLPIESVSLGFQNSGTIARVYHKVGDRVSAGETLAQLNTASLQAALQQAQAAYNAAVASRSSTSLPETATDARNAYLSAYTTLDTALQEDIDTFFGNPTAYGPALLINAPMYDYGELPGAREALSNNMYLYKQALSGAATSDPMLLLASASSAAQNTSNFLNKLAVAANDRNSGASATQLAALSSARASIATLLSTLSAAQQAYRSQSVGATSLADASVEQAAAGVAVAKANLQGTEIVAPLSGVVTVFDAKVGQIAIAGAPLVSLISENAFEVEAGVPETDIGRVAVGNVVSMTLDAFPGETFSGRVFYIDPAQTSTGGAVDYKTKISFDKVDRRMKSGLTANLDIQTRSKEEILLLPQYAILQNDEGTFVEVLRDGNVVTEPVVLGIQDADGMVEILSGVTEGQEVLNIGLKQ